MDEITNEREESIKSLVKAKGKENKQTTVIFESLGLHVSCGLA